MKDAEKKEELEINLSEQKIIRKDNELIGFEIDPFRKKCLIEGLDDIGLTLEKSESIDIFEKKIENSYPWII